MRFVDMALSADADDTMRLRAGNAERRAYTDMYGYSGVYRRWGSGAIILHSRKKSQMKRRPWNTKCTRVYTGDYRGNTRGFRN